MGILALIVEGLAFAGLDLGIDAVKNLNSGKPDATIIELVIGSGGGGGMDGKTPHVALWNEAGERLGQSGPVGSNKHNDKGKADEGGNPTYTIQHDQGHDGSAQASYLMMSNIDVDAICISAIFVTDDRVSTAIFGDLPKKCGISWGHSDRPIGDAQQIPSCFWLDADGTNGLNAQAISFHLRDMVANGDRISQFNERLDSLCSSTPRFSFWGDLLPDSMIPIFDPPLDYARDAKNGGIGRDLDIDRVLDKGVIDKSVGMYQGALHLKRQPMNSTSSIPGTRNVPIPNSMVKKRDASGAARRRKRSNQMRQHLVVTPHWQHSAKELCESKTSWGPDEVSLHERKFCDMETKTLYDLCDNKVKTNCFDLATETLMLPKGAVKQDDVDVQARAVPAVKQYNTTSYW